MKYKLPKPKKPFTRWSYSAWASWKECAFRFYHAYYLGMRGPSNFAMDRGTHIHSLQENYLKGKIIGVPRALADLQVELRGLKAAKPIVEQFWGVTSEWMPSKNEKTSWCVMKMDAAVPPSRKDRTLYIQDLKTGRVYPDKHEAQGSLYATIGHALYHTVERVEVEFWYADQDGHVETYTFDSKKLKQIRKKWDAEGRAMFDPKQEYIPTPSDDACRWCHLRTDKGQFKICDGWKRLKKTSSSRR